MKEGATKKELIGLTLLGATQRKPVRRLEAFPNRNPGRGYSVTLVCPEFTCVCPMTGQPDFGTITIRYVPDKRILESKSLKLYLWSYRQEGVFHEHVTNVILDDVVKALEPRSCTVTGAFHARGGISITVEASYEKPTRKTTGRENSSVYSSAGRLLLSPLRPGSRS